MFRVNIISDAKCDLKMRVDRTKAKILVETLLNIKGNVAVYKVLNLEMLLYKVRWHVSTVKECNFNRPILTLRTYAT